MKCPVHADFEMDLTLFLAAKPGRYFRNIDDVKIKSLRIPKHITPTPIINLIYKKAKNGQKVHVKTSNL
jgi:hypothetical protein